MTNEERHYADLAALLDPSCYTFHSGTNWTLTVPAGKVWHLVNGWALRHVDNYKWHHRNLNEPLLLPSGFVLTADDVGFAYYADLSIVQDTDPRYQTDPKGLYFERINKLRTIPLEKVSTHRPLNTPYSTPIVGVPFPQSCERIVIRHIDCHDGCWLIFAKSDFSNAMNTQDELDDVRPMRFTKSMCVPMLRSVHSHIYLGHGTINGPGTPQTYNGWGQVLFQRLPADW